MKNLFFTGVLGILLFSLNTTGFADEAQESAYLQQILNQLRATQPFIVAAAKAQPKNLRQPFHYSAFKDAQGQLHNGLLEDVQAIEKGIQEKLNGVSNEPRTVAPINGDYLTTP